MKFWTKRKGIYIILILVFASIFLWMQQTRTIDRLYSGVVFDQQGTIERSTTIRINGYMTSGTKGKNVFNGYFEVDGIHIPINTQPDGTIGYTHFFDSGIIIKPDNTSGNDELIGHLIFMKKLSYVYIDLKELNDKLGSSCMVVGPVQTKEDAEILMKKYIRK